MKLSPRKSAATPSYPSKTVVSAPRFSKKIRRIAAAIGTSAALGLAACGSCDSDPGSNDLRLSGEAPAVHIRPDVIPLAGAPMPPQYPPSTPGSNLIPPDPNIPPKDTTANTLDPEPVHMRGVRRAPTPPGQPRHNQSPPQVSNGWPQGTGSPPPTIPPINPNEPRLAGDIAGPSLHR